MSDNAAILDELFGADRNLPISQRGQGSKNYWSDDVCKYNLVSLCFNDLWKHTKYDQDGECSKRHDQHYVKAFQQDNSLKKLNREKQFIADAVGRQDKIKEVDKILKRHEQTMESKDNLNIDRPKEVQERLESLKIQQRKLLDESERLGEIGKLEESERLAQEAENCKKASEEYLMAYESTLNPYKTCRVCDVCGAKQALQETERKQQTHLEGKIHQGFATIRSELVKLLNRKVIVDELLKSESERDKKPVKERSRSRQKSKERQKSSKKEREKEKSIKKKDLSKSPKKDKNKNHDKEKKKEKKHKHDDHSDKKKKFKERNNELQQGSQGSQK